MFWLTGSQQFQMMKGVSETLAGRVAILNLLGFSRRERHRLALDVPPFLPTQNVLAARQDAGPPQTLAAVYQEMWTGGFPALVAGPVEDRDLFYGSYLQTYLQRDVRDLARVGDETAFLRFLKACAARTGQLLNLSDLARDADLSLNTAKAWLSILQASFQVYLLQPYHSNLTKRLVKTPKLYFLDTGLCAYLSEWSSPRTLEAGAMADPLFETHVFAEVLKSWWHQGEAPQVYYYRDRDGKEVDLLFLQDQTLYPVEIKRSASPKREWVRGFPGLDRFAEDRGEGGVVCLCPQSLPLADRATAIPVGLL